jgi:hypothetical protein
LGFFGIEGDRRRAISVKELNSVVSITDQRLSEAGLAGLPALHIEWEEDV